MIRTKVIQRLGYAASIITVLLWFILLWMDPYFEGMNKASFGSTLMMLFLPACLFSAGLALSRSILLLIAFIWSFPYSFYMLLTNSIFLLFGMTNFIYLLCYVLTRINKTRKLG